MEQLIAIARERGMASICGLVLAENTHMLALARKLGFDISKVPNEPQYELRKDLRPVNRGLKGHPALHGGSS